MATAQARPIHNFAQIVPSDDVNRGPSMIECSRIFQSAQEVRRFVADTLGRLESLLPDQFKLEQNLSYRAGKPCGVYFCLHGPRALKLSAIWETEQNSILFYGSCGKRVQRTKLSQSLALDS